MNPKLLNGLLGLILSPSLVAAPNTWTGAVNGTWDVGATANWTSPTTWTNSVGGTPQNAIFGATGAGTITLASGVQTQGIAINANGYTFNGGPLAITVSQADPSSIAPVTIASNVSFTLNSAYQYAAPAGSVLGASTHIFNLGAGSSLTMTGGGSFNNAATNYQWNLGGSSNAQTATTNLDGGTYSGITSVQTTGTVNHRAATVTANSDLVIGAHGSSIYNVSNAAAVLSVPGQNVFSGGRIVLGNSAGTVSDRKSVQLNVSNGQVTAQNRVIVGNANFTDARLNVSGGSLSLTSPAGSATAASSGIFLLKQAGGSADQTAEINLSGTGVITTRFISFGGESGSNTNSSAALNVTGGSLYLGSGTANGGTVNDALRTGAAAPTTTSINLGGGTVGAVQNWNSSMAMNLTGTNGNVKFRAQDSSTNARNITLSGKLSGSGGLEKTGLGSLTLNASVTNDYAGGTRVSEGTLVAATAGSLGSGNVEVLNGSTLTLGNNAVIADLATLFVATGASVVLDFASGSDIVAAITNTTNSNSVAAGTYTASQLNGLLGASIFSGAGALTVIPEPSSLLLGIYTLGVVCGLRRRRAGH